MHSKAILTRTITCPVFEMQSGEYLSNTTQRWTNQGALQGHGLVHKLLTVAGPHVLRHTKHAAHQPIMALLEVLAAHSMDELDLRTYLEVCSKTNDDQVSSLAYRVADLLLIMPSFEFL